MRLLATHQPRGAEIALCDVELCPGVKLFGVKLMRAADGSHRAYAKNVTFSPAVIEDIANQFKGRLPDARYN